MLVSRLAAIPTKMVQAGRALKCFPVPNVNVAILARVGFVLPIRCKLESISYFIHVVRAKMQGKGTFRLENIFRMC
jgi:hypothetical protein